MRPYLLLGTVTILIVAGAVSSSATPGTRLAPAARGATRHPPKSTPAQRRPNIEKQSDPKSDESDKAAPTNNNGKVAGPAGPGANASARKGRKRAVEQHRSLPSEYTLTLAVNVPDADVIVDGEKLGTTGKDGKLKTPLKAGRRNITVSHPDYRSVSKPIDVGPGLVELNFQLEEQPKPVARRDASFATISSAPDPGPNTEAVFQRFIDTPAPDAVSADEWKEVLSQCEKSLTREPKNVQTRSRMLFAQGQVAYTRREYTLALVAFTEAAQNNPEYALAYFGSGNCYSAVGLPHEALRSYQRTVQLLPNFALGHKALADLLTKGGRRKEANESYRTARQLGYARPEIGLMIARNLITDRLWTEALGELKPLIEKTPSADVWTAAAECYEALKYPFSAAMAYSRSVDLDKSNPVAYYKLGGILFGQHEYWSAQEALERAIALDPNGDKINVADARRKAKESADKLHK